MGKKKDFRPMKPICCSRVHPNLHHNIAEEILGDIGSLRFHEIDSNEGSTKDYSTFVMGLFICRNRACPRTIWGSGMAGVQMELPRFTSGGRLPHKAHLCQGCKRGICRELTG
ncbi:hypothetical protein T440DRAFT_489319 [Plenodomus tracheiphilus IPT5]|uniref:Zinc-binding domain-containing protein n=1 Tax=Plenodomus tracheiphilus IPT5 TaxID=1408161 RepID=A0A6A7BAU6_9PLEO|nr:hypothetical protein T440DRAFT_489319 [Plenodomus tracheiphilus IPT5]